MILVQMLTHSVSEEVFVLEKLLLQQALKSRLYSLASLIHSGHVQNIIHYFFRGKHFAIIAHRFLFFNKVLFKAQFTSPIFLHSRQLLLELTALFLWETSI